MNKTTTNAVANVAVNRARHCGEWGTLDNSGSYYCGYSRHFKYGEMENVTLTQATVYNGCGPGLKSGVAIGQLVRTNNKEPIQFPVAARPLKFKNEQFFDVLTRQTVTECSKLFLLTDGRSLYLP
jgi:hypothetical protein